MEGRGTGTGIQGHGELSKGVDSISTSYGEYKRSELTSHPSKSRFDSESYSYGFSWSQEILDEWDWTEHFAPQPETERYINFICDKFGLREYIQFNTRIKSAEWQERSRSWKLTDFDSRSYTSRFVVTAIGVLCKFRRRNYMAHSW